ncbi:hypothetical protein ACFV7Q_23780 [Streptomyces sp. NPDC059851]|uniref:hypothetical protein n=1 Tax=Streptomyces sp. NPDC059851 TaxID=3346971 RepID=UPI00365ED793
MVSTVGDDGCARVPVSGRILESALLLRLLRLEHHLPEVRSRLTSFLRAQDPGHDEAGQLDSAILSWLFPDRKTIDPADVERASATGISGFVTDRRRHFARALAVIFGAASQPCARPVPRPSPRPAG